MKYYAIMHETGKVIAEGTFRECWDEALKYWDKAPGSAAPYCITTLAPDICTNCEGSGKVKDWEDSFECGHCEGTGYAMNPTPMQSFTWIEP